MTVEDSVTDATSPLYQPPFKAWISVEQKQQKYWKQLTLGTTEGKHLHLPTKDEAITF